MKLYMTVAVSMLAGALLGGVATETLRAQAKGPVYSIGLQDVSNPEALAKEFVAPARESIRKYGGKTLGGGKPVVIDGSAPSQRMTLNQWDSVEQAKTWFNSPEYQKAREIGNKYAKFNIVVIDAVPAP